MGPSLQSIRTPGSGLPKDRRSRPLFASEQAAQTLDAAQNSTPKAHGLPGHAWTIKKLRQWVYDRFGRGLSRGVLRDLLKRAGLSWKKCKRFFSKADPEKREEFVSDFQKLFERLVKKEIMLIYVDESHFHKDLQSGYGWGQIGKRIWRESISPGLSERINWYGAYNFTTGQCFLWSEGGMCNTYETCRFLEALAEWIGETKKKVIIVWDRASWHMGELTKARAEGLDLMLAPLPAYSPDLNAIEGLWKWMREEVTNHYCHKSLGELYGACQDFIKAINQNPLAVVDRLWPKFELDPEYEKLLLST